MASNPAATPVSQKVNVFLLSQVNLLDENGRKIRAATIWEKQKVVLIFLRHFACIACRAHAVQIWGQRELYEKNGAKVIFIGNGPASFIRGFKEDLKIVGAPVYTDPSLESFRVCGFKHGFLNLVKPATVVNAISLALDGHRQGPLQRGTGDHWQLGGVVVITPKNEVVFHFISESLGDHPPEKDVLPST